MNAAMTELARVTLAGSEAGTLSFGECVQRLMQAGFDGYAVDFRQARRIHYLPDGEALALPIERTAVPVAESFDAAAVRAAILEAQQQTPGYSYRSFCGKVTAAGCAGYLVSFPGRRVLYYGRNGETHTELFPGARP